MKRAVIVGLGVCLIVGGLRAQSGPAENGYELLLSFPGVPDGSSPDGTLLKASDEHVYGTTLFGGAADSGTVYRRTREGLFQTVASFDGTNGSLPSGGLVEVEGQLYGTTEEGGPFAEGNVFHLDPVTGAVIEIATFDLLATGAFPMGGLVVAHGSLWGTTTFGPCNPETGECKQGTVFRLSLETGELTTVVEFTGNTGAGPVSGLALAPDGDLYGATIGDEFAEPAVPGTLFKVSSDGSFQVLKSFNGLDEGLWPWARPLIASDGAVYGTTVRGGDADQGVIYRFDPATSEFSVVAHFNAVSAAGAFQAGLVELNGTLYGAAAGGSESSAGIVYRVDGNQVVPIHHFDGIDALLPNNTLIVADGALYGTTDQPNGGTMFRITLEQEVAATLALEAAQATYGGGAELKATLSSSAGPIAGAQIDFGFNGMSIPAITDAAGMATVSVSVAGLNAGTYPGAITATSAAAPDVAATADLTIVRATPIVTVTGGTFVYDTLPHAASATVTGIADDVLVATITYNGRADAPVEPGAYMVSATFAGDANYEPVSATASLTIMPPAPGVTGLIAAYGFNEGAGTIAADSSGRGHVGVIRKATYVNGRFGGALSFDGKGDWVTIADHADLNLRTAMTIEAWVNPTKLSGWNTIALKQTSDSLAYALYANDDVPRPAGYVNIGGVHRSVAGTGSLPLNTWTHVAVTYGGGMMRLYLNGTEVSRRSLIGNIVAGRGPLRIGGNSIWEDEFFSGLIDEVRIYGVALSAADIQRDMNMPIARETEAPTVSIASPLEGDVLSGRPAVTIAVSDNVAVASVQLMVDGVLVGNALGEAPYTARLDAANGVHTIQAVARDTAGNTATSAPVTIRIANRRVADYQFNEGGGSTIVDQSGLGNNGVMTSSGVFRATDVARGSVMQFSGGRISVPDADSLDLKAAMTLEAWVKPTALSGWRTVVLKEGTDVLAYALYANDDAPRPAGYVRVNGSDRAVRGPRALPLGEWTHLAMTYDGQTMRLFVNGEEKESRAQVGNALVTNGRLSIGGNTVWGEYFRGQMDDVRIYDVAVGEAQIKADMNGVEPQ